MIGLLNRRHVMFKTFLATVLLLSGIGQNPQINKQPIADKIPPTSRRVAVTQDDAEVAKDPIKIKQAKYELYENSSMQIDYTLEGLSKQATVSFKSENPDIVSVSEKGLITAITKGSSIITIVAVDGEEIYTKEISVKVNVLDGTINFKNEDVYINRGFEYELEYTLSNDAMKDKSIIWSSDNTAVADVVNGKVTAKSAGTTTITARIGTITSSVKVTVTIPLRDIEFNPSNLTIVLEDEVSIPDLIFVPYDTTTSRNASYVSEDNGIVEVVEDRLVAKKIGKTKVTATIGEHQAELEVTVKSKQTESGADIIKLKVDKEEGDRLVLVTDNLSKADNQKYALTLPDEILTKFIEARDHSEVILVLDDVLLEKDMTNLESFIVSETVMSALADKTLSIHLVDKRNVPLIIYNFQGAYPHDVDLRFKIMQITERSPLYEQLSGRAFELVFANQAQFGEGTTVELSAKLIESTFSQMHFIYERTNESDLEFTNQEVSVSNEDRLKFLVTNNDYVITFNKLAKTDDHFIIISLLIIVLTIVGGSGFFYFNKYKKKKKL